MKIIGVNEEGKDIKTYKMVEEAFDAKYNSTKEFLKN